MKPMFRAIGSSVVAIALTLAGTPAHAALEYIFQGTASGTYDGSPFSDEAFTITFTGGSIQPISSEEIFDTGVTGTIQVGSVVNTLTSGYELVDNQSTATPRIGFGYVQLSPTVEVYVSALQNAAFETYGFTTTLGLTGDTTSGANFDLTDTFPTTTGGFQFTSVSNDTFEAINVSGVPELSTWAMMLIGFGLVGFKLRRRGAVLAT